MPGLTDEERRQLDELLGTTTAPPSAVAPPVPPIPGTLPPDIAGVAYPASFTRKGLRVNIPPPASEVQRQLEVSQQKTQMAEESATRRQLLKKAADQKLQLEQSIGLFNKIYDEAEQSLPRIQQPFPGTLRPQQAIRFLAREGGLDEKARGTIQSFKARATPVLKSLGEVGVLTNQDIERILAGGMPSDLDTDESFAAKRLGIISDLQAKLDQVNRTLGVAPTSSPPASGGRKRLPSGVQLPEGLHTDAQGRRIRVYRDGTYTPE